MAFLCCFWLQFNLQTIFYTIKYNCQLEREENSKGLTVDEAIDNAMTFHGKPITDHDREIIRGIVEAYLNKK